MLTPQHLQRIKERVTERDGESLPWTEIDSALLVEDALKLLAEVERLTDENTNLMDRAGIHEINMQHHPEDIAKIAELEHELDAYESSVPLAMKEVERLTAENVRLKQALGREFPVDDIINNLTEDGKFVD